MSKKMIILNPKFMSSAKSSKAKTQRKREVLKKSNITNTGTLRKKLLNKIKDFQKKNEESSESSQNRTASSNSKPNAVNSASMKSISGNNIENDHRGDGDGSGGKTTDDTEDLSKEFDKSLQFLHNLSSSRKNKSFKKQNNKKHGRSTDVTNHNSVSEIKISNKLPNDLLQDSKMNVPVSHISIKNYSKPPPYGCLKNGEKPTYREWKRKTQRNLGFHEETPQLSDRELSLKKIKAEFHQSKNAQGSQVSTSSSPTSVGTTQHNIQINMPNEMTKTEQAISTTHESNPRQHLAIASPIPDKMNQNIMSSNTSISSHGAEKSSPSGKHSGPRKEHRITTKTFKLGKNKTSKTIGVLIKNRHTRRRISKEKDLLKKKSILEVKNYLRKYNLLKAGSDAPSDVLRTMYEQSILAGEVNNESKETLVHNYYSK